MEVGQHTDGAELERQDALSVPGEPLRSELRIGEYLPRVLSRLDLLVLFIAIVLFVPNVSLVQANHGGSATYLYWILGTLTFLAPGALASAQLNRFLPADGGLYVWTHRALGPLWGFFAAFCAWFPGMLVLISGADAVITLLQGIGVEIAGPGANWLMVPAQQGLLVIGLVCISGWISTLRLKPVMRCAAGIIVVYAVAIGVVGLAGVIWLAQGHSSQTPFRAGDLGAGFPDFAIYGIIVLALLGVEVPLNLAAETSQPRAPALFLRWGPFIVLLAYLVGTFGVMTVVPPQLANAPYSTLTAVGAVFGPTLAVLVGSSFIGFFIIVAVLYNVAFARILFVAALDHRLPSALLRINRHGAPANVIGVQVAIVLAVAIFTYFLGPFIFHMHSQKFTFQVYDVTQAAATLIWCISMLLMFLDLPVLLLRLRARAERLRGRLVAPLWLLYLCCALGGATSLLGILTTLSASWDITLLSNGEWTLSVGGLTLVCLVIGLVSSAYPGLLSSLNEQTAVARENARLYSELSAAYTKLSELDLLKDAFLASASHELRTPLTVVQGYLELLGEVEDLDPAQKRKFIHKARRACNELVLLQSNIMDASRLHIDAGSLHFTRIQLLTVSSAIVDLFEPLLSRDARHIDIDVPAGIVVWADELRLKQVLHNLLTNALHYSPRATTICLRAQSVEGQHMARVSVTDRGLGVPPDKHEAIFERFVRLERDAQGGMRGNGLGLAISRQLVEAMGGSISVESRGIAGDGTTFTFTLPFAPR
jgi:glutamate:GABA antiporter